MTPAARSQLSQQSPESLRERKKRMTREAIYAAAEALFGERGFDDVTVAEIADAANISVKTLFTYIGTKEELLFNGRPSSTPSWRPSGTGGSPRRPSSPSGRRC